MNYRTDPTSASAPGSYAVTRYNATKWATTVSGPMPCLGSRCRYRYCDSYRISEATPGWPCPWETWYAVLLARNFRDEHGHLERFVEDFDGLCAELVDVLLQRQRNAMRTNAAILRLCDDHRINATVNAELVLTGRYDAALMNRLQAVMSQLVAASDRLVAYDQQLKLAARGMAPWPRMTAAQSPMA